MNDPKEKNNNPITKRNNIIKGVLIAVLVIAIVAVAIAILRQLELARDAAPEGAGTAASRGTISERDMEIVEDLGLDLTAEDEYPLLEADEAEPTLYYKGQPYKYNENLSTLLIMGIDDYEIEESKSYRNTSQADVLLLAVFDEENRTCRLIQLNRDMMVDVPVLGLLGNYLGTVEGQLALAHTYGKGLEDSCENTVLAVSLALYNVEIDNYFALTMNAIPILNDLVGGVAVTIEDDFTGVDDTLQKGETVTLDSGNVEHFVRARMSMTDDPTNTARMRRQREYLIRLIAALSKAAQEDSSFVVDAYGQVADYLITDCGIDELNAYGEQFAGYTLTDILTLDGEYTLNEETEFAEYSVDDDDVQRLVIETFYFPAEE